MDNKENVPAKKTRVADSSSSTGPIRAAVDQAMQQQNYNWAPHNPLSADLTRTNPLSVTDSAKDVKLRPEVPKSSSCRMHKYVLKKKNQRDSYVSVDALDFEQFVKTSTLIVDRTEFLEFLWTGRHIRTIVIALPPGVGKTLILTMARGFFEYLDDNQAKKATRDALFKQQFEHNKKFHIMQNEAFVEEHYGRYPVLYICLSDVEGNGAEIEDQLNRKIIGLFEANKRFYDELDERDFRRDRWQKFMRKIRPMEWSEAVRLLISLMVERVGRDAIVLIDNYDAPITNSPKLFDKDDWEGVTSLVRRFIGAFESALRIKQLLLAGSYQFGIEKFKIIAFGMEKECGSGTDASRDLCRFFGFRQEEFDELCDSYKFEQKDLAREYFNGIYTSGIPLLSTWPIIQLLETPSQHNLSEFSPFQKENLFMQNFIPLFRNINVAKAIKGLLNDEDYSIEKCAKKGQISTGDVRKLLDHARQISSSSPVKVDVTDLFIAFLLASGYLVRVDSKLRIPNLALRDTLMNHVIDNFYAEKYRFPNILMNNVTDSLEKIVYEGSMDSAGQLKGALEAIMMVSDGVVNRNEHGLHVIFEYGLFRLRKWTKFSGDFRRGGDDGYQNCRPDIVLCSAKKKCALCVELKWDCRDKRKTAEFALGQIAESKYLFDDKIVSMSELERIVAIGCSGKEEKDEDGQLLLEIDLLVECAEQQSNADGKKETSLALIERFQGELEAKYANN